MDNVLNEFDFLYVNMDDVLLFFRDVRKSNGIPTNCDRLNCRAELSYKNFKVIFAV